MLIFDDLRQTDPDYFEFDWNLDVVAEWRPGEFVSVAAVRRPLVPNGFLLVCATAGQTQARQPSIPRTDAASLVDGSVTWTVTKALSATVPTIATVGYSISPSGVTQSGASIVTAEGKSLVKLDASAADLGGYTITAEMVDSNGEDHTIEATFNVIA